jgi:hypothetical protein
MADKRGEIDMTYQAMSALTGWPLELLKQAINELMQPDPESRSDEHEGRRLVLIDANRSWGWRVVNHTKDREKARKSASDVERATTGDNKRRMSERRPAMTRDDPRPPAAPGADPPSDSDADTDSNKEKNQESSASPPVATPVEQVFQHWQQEWGHAKAMLDPKRRRLIDARLKNFSVQQLRDAISGFKNSPWHTGEDPKGNGTVYDGLQTLLRDTAQVEEGMRLFAHPPRPPPKVEQLSPVERVLRANGVNRDERVVAEQFGSGNAGVGSADRDVRDAPYAGLRRIGS